MTARHAYGWSGPSIPDQRDWYHDFSSVAELPAEVDLTKTGYLPKTVWDQSQLGACVSHGTGKAFVFDLAKQGAIPDPDAFMPARLFIYYNGRVLERTVNDDSGLTITDGIKAIASSGAAPETDWPYDISRFTEKPPQQAFSDGKLREAVKYARVNQTVGDMQACLAGGLPIVIGFTVYESFESAEADETGDISMPGSSEQVLGGHCVLVVGYVIRNGKLTWKFVNSWGESWGDGGYGYFPLEYLTNSSLADDFWTVQQVSSPDPGPTPPGPLPPTPVSDLWSKTADQFRSELGQLSGQQVVDVRQRGGIEQTFKSAGVEVMVKNLHPGR